MCSAQTLHGTPSPVALILLRHRRTLKIYGLKDAAQGAAKNHWNEAIRRWFVGYLNISLPPFSPPCCLSSSTKEPETDKAESKDLPANKLLLALKPLGFL